MTIGAAARLKRATKAALNRLGVLPWLALIRKGLSKRGRVQIRRDRKTLDELKRALRNGMIVSANRARGRKSFLVYGPHEVAPVVAQLPILLAARVLNYRIWVLLPTFNALVKRAYTLCGVRDFLFLSNFLKGELHPRAASIERELQNANDLKDITYKGCRVGKYALSTLMRWNRVGHPDIDDPETRKRLRLQLNEALQAADAADAIVGKAKPAITLLNERGYSPFGEVFDSVLARGGECLTWNAAHRNNMLMLKRYHRSNVDVNHFSLSNLSWNRINAIPWSDENWHRVRDEIVDSYQSGEWFSECATQFDKASIEHDELVRRLGLDRARPTACIFPHMFWDATFFWGEDLFDDYEHWFTEVLKVAGQNRQVNWIIKIHPANVAKAIRDGYHGEYSEVLAIRKTLGNVPNHIKIIPPESDISTLSLLSVIDYCLTVRGTVGIEAAAFGIRTLTAGTGRYDRLGFTSDFATAGEYLNALRRLPDIAPMSESEVELARRFAYGVFVARPTPLVSVGYGFQKSLGAEIQVSVNGNAATMAKAADVLSLAEWIGSGEDDYLSPLAGDGAISPELAASP